MASKINKRALVVYSGGMDSRTVLAYALKNYETVDAVSFYYGQRHSKELLAAEKVIEGLEDVHQYFIDAESTFKMVADNALTGKAAVPEGHYNDETMAKTVVPNRNLLFITVASAIAHAKGYDVILLGVHAGDHHIYPDCRPDFIESVRNTIFLSLEGKVELITPFLHFDKGDIVKWGIDHGVDYKDTWTCYKGKAEPCGKCGACVERAEAFEKAGVPDPLLR